MCQCVNESQHRIRSLDKLQKKSSCKFRTIPRRRVLSFFFSFSLTTKLISFSSAKTCSQKVAQTSSRWQFFQLRTYFSIFGWSLGRACRVKGTKRSIPESVTHQGVNESRQRILTVSWPRSSYSFRSRKNYSQRVAKTSSSWHFFFKRGYILWFNH